MKRKTGFLSPKLQNWYEANKRDLPWRRTRDPYIIWLSEIILQQTRVKQGLPYFEKFISAYNSVQQLAAASEKNILRLWQGLGYYSRAINLHATAKEVEKKYDGVFPGSYEELITLKGVGKYTAAAIASFAFNKPHAVVDGNVSRVIARYFGVKDSINKPCGQRKIELLAGKILDKKNPGLHNQAIMEFGARQCKPLSPDCNNCPLQTGCFAFSKNLVSKLPVKEKKKAIRHRHFNYFLFHYKNNIAIRQRTASDIWKYLYELPMAESYNILKPLELFQKKEWKKTFSKYKPVVAHVSPHAKHILSHQVLHAVFTEIKFQKKPEMNSVFKNCIWIHRSKLDTYAFPRLIEKYLKERNWYPTA
jgi:A/G-specific adenine glycosylase